MGSGEKEGKGPGKRVDNIKTKLKKKSKILPKNLLSFDE